MNALALVRQHELGEDVQFNPKQNCVRRKRVGAPTSSYKGRNTSKAAKIVVKEEQRRLVALNYKGKDTPEVCKFFDDLVVFDGLIRFLSNDTEQLIRAKLLPN